MNETKGNDRELSDYNNKRHISTDYNKPYKPPKKIKWIQFYRKANPVEWFLLGVTFLLAIANVWIVIYAASQADSAANTFHLANESMILQNRKDSLNTVAQVIRDSINIQGFKLENRAYIVSTEAIMETFEIGKKITVEMKFENVGKTPAYKCNITSHLKVISMQDSNWFPKIQPIQQRSHLTIGNEVIIGSKMSGDSAIDSNFYNLIIENKTYYIMAYGVINYYDIFNEPHFTQYCFFYKPTVGFAGFHKYNDSN
ncbi:MAG: hypothetical protein EPO24_14175 [Bacteroidetes bacterium]|nr:MAG: hypothetical protein EPO24_14175 [Bacteroidota bacterium]